MPKTKPQPHPGLQPSLPRMEARPGITHATVHLPPGVLPTTNCLPDMSSYINAIDFFAHPERQPDPKTVPRTTVTITPMSQMNQGEENQSKKLSMEVVPLGTYEAGPLEPGFLNMPFQTISTMDFRLEPQNEGDYDPTRTSYNAEISPPMMLTMYQQHRLQAALLQNEVPLVDALMPVIMDIRRECAEMRQPLAMPSLPYATMQFYSKPVQNPSLPLLPSLPSLPLSLPPKPPRAGGYRSRKGRGSGNRQRTEKPRMVLLPTPQIVPIPPRNPPQRYPVVARPNFNPNFYQQPRCPAIIPPNPNFVQQPPRYPVYFPPGVFPRCPVYFQPGFAPRYDVQPPRFPVFPHPNGIPNNPAALPYYNEGTFFNQY
ncbi:protein app1-like [Drosophila serrata]|uniref:protein app1-like n=1 Tax=Drosophila serrata TaxID=7274 RepID=UPI000A1CFC2F|nr:protein app1-like [Drosophila serrata]